jgi:hypothetical protein
VGRNRRPEQPGQAEQTHSIIVVPSAAGHATGGDFFASCFNAMDNHFLIYNTQNQITHSAKANRVPSASRVLLHCTHISPIATKKLLRIKQFCDDTSSKAPSLCF